MHPYRIIKFLLILVFTLPTWMANAQSSLKKNKKKLFYTETTATSYIYGPFTAKEINTKLDYIYTYNPVKMLTGNPCVTDYTRGLGFEYAGVYTTIDENDSHLAVFFHNLKIKTKLFFTKGPLWGFRVRKHIKQCRKSSGDFVG